MNKEKNTPLSEVEGIKQRSNYLRGTLQQSLNDELTGALAPDDANLIRLHGSYQQTDRDRDAERKRQKLEPLFSFMIRVRVPGGIISPRQWLVLDQLSEEYANNTLKLTTRQAVQFHGVLKRHLKPTIQGFYEVLMDSFAACGDVVRNVMCFLDPKESRIHQRVYAIALDIHQKCTPQTRAYHEIWIDNERISPDDEIQDTEPLYGATYLPRKFKIALALPPYNDTDVFANDIGLIAIVEQDELTGFNVAIGGGLGTTFGDAATYPRLATVIGFIQPEQVLETVQHIVQIQRDYGNRSNRKQARLKYTIDRMGLKNFITELQNRSAFRLLPEKPYSFISNADRYGWVSNKEGIWSGTLFIEGGRVKDNDRPNVKTALREIAGILLKQNTGDFRLTGNQNLMISGLNEPLKHQVQKTLELHGVHQEAAYSGLRLNSIACVALNTCALAFAEAERYLPDLINKIEPLLQQYSLIRESISIRMSGCPNGCARPQLAEIGFIGKSLGKYNMYLGGAISGERLNILYRENLGEQEILQELDTLFARFVAERLPDEGFGNFLIRQNIVSLPL